MRLENPRLLGVSVLGANQCDSIKVGSNEWGLHSRGPKSGDQYGYTIYEISASQKC